MTQHWTKYYRWDPLEWGGWGRPSVTTFCAGDGENHLTDLVRSLMGRTLRHFQSVCWDGEKPTCVGASSLEKWFYLVVIIVHQLLRSSPRMEPRPRQALISALQHRNISLCISVDITSFWGMLVELRLEITSLWPAVWTTANGGMQWTQLPCIPSSALLDGWLRWARPEGVTPVPSLSQTPEKRWGVTCYFYSHFFILFFYSGHHGNWCVEQGGDLDGLHLEKLSAFACCKSLCTGCNLEQHRLCDW